MSRGRKPTVLINDIREGFCEHWFGRPDHNTWPLWIDDIISGVARLDWYGDREKQIPLSTTNIIRCFVFLDQISTDTVMELLEFKKSQAKLYVKACCLCYPFLKSSLRNPESLQMRYPGKTIVTYDQGLKYHYNVQHKTHI